jgi:2-phospho-L-lactate guanylyltransferase (CobY/MobA/RfbA family)
MNQQASNVNTATDNIANRKVDNRTKVDTSVIHLNSKVDTVLDKVQEVIKENSDIPKLQREHVEQLQQLNQQNKKDWKIILRVELPN